MDTSRVDVEGTLIISTPRDRQNPRPRDSLSRRKSTNSAGATQREWISAAGALPGRETDLPRFVGDFIAEEVYPYQSWQGAAPVNCLETKSSSFLNLSLSWRLTSLS